jgi:serine/threonine protein kinase
MSNTVSYKQYSFLKYLEKKYELQLTHSFDITDRQKAIQRIEQLTLIKEVQKFAISLYDRYMSFECTTYTYDDIAKACIDISNLHFGLEMTLLTNAWIHNSILEKLNYTLLVPDIQMFIYYFDSNSLKYDIMPILKDDVLSRILPSITSQVIILCNNPEFEVEEEDVNKIKFCLSLLDKTNIHIKNTIKRNLYDLNYVNIASDINTLYSTYAKLCPKFSYSSLIEMSILQEISNPNIIKFITLAGNNETFPHEKLIVEEKLTMDLHNYINDNLIIPFNTVKYIFYEVAKGLEYLHSIGICHADLRPENILMKCQKGKIIEVKIADFDDSKVILPAIKLYDRAITAMTERAPEIVYSDPQYSDCEYDFAVDIWSYGITLSEVILKRTYKGTNYPPIVRHNYKNMISTKTGRFNVENSHLTVLIKAFLSNLDKEIKDNRYDKYEDWIYKLMSMCLKFNPHDRITAKGIVEFIHSN